jgi:radical SAM protein with 4Fe4S-binding SPASM domain
MRCLHCGTSAGKKRPDELSTEEALNLIDELAGLGCEHLTLSGGEPLLREDWPLLTERIRKNGLMASLITNGFLITEKVADDFRKCGLQSVGVSFDGTEKTHNLIRQRNDSWKRAYNSLKILADRGFDPCAVTQVSNLNLNELYDIRKLLLDIDCKIWRIQMTTSTGRMRDHQDLVLTLDNYPRFIDVILDMQQMDGIFVDVGENIGYYGCKGTKLRNGGIYMGCYAGTFVAGIESNGNIKGCLSMPEEYVEGNIRDSSFTEIWNRADGFSYNRQFTRMTAEGECRDCKYLILCRGGCANTSISATGKRADNPYCIYRIERQQGIICEDSEYIRGELDRAHEILEAANAKVN